MIGKNIGGFQIEGGPYRGGFGEVYKVRETFSNDLFALKTIKESLVQDAKAISMFKQEMNHWLRLPGHISIVRAISAFEIKGQPFLVMEWAYGNNLDVEMPNMDIIEAWVAVLHISWGIWHMHKHGLLHGDLKPSNIVTSHGFTKLTDFGFAKLHTDSKTIIGGTPEFMAPEIYETGPSFSSDIYAAGLVFLKIFAKFDESEHGVAELREICRKMTKPAPNERFASFSDFLPDIEKKFKLPKTFLEHEDNVHNAYTFKEDFREKSHDYSLMMEQAISYRVSEQYTKARELLIKILRIHGDRIETLVETAEVCINCGNYDDAFGYLKRAIKVMPEEWEWRYRIACLFSNIQKFDDVLYILEEIQLNKIEVKNAAAILMIIASAKHGKGHLDEAIEKYHNSLEMNESNETRIRLASCLFEAGRIDEALYICKDLPEGEGLYEFKRKSVIGRIYLSKGMYDEGIEILIQSLKYPVSSLFKRTNCKSIGEAYLTQGYIKEAKMYFRMSEKT